MNRGMAGVPSLLNGYAVVVFDCDGVLLDSNRFKIDAFRTVAADAGFDPAVVEAFSAFQAANFGTSRYRLFELLLSGQFGPTVPVALDQLLDAYGAACRSGYLKVAETPGMRDALDRAGQGRGLYVVSGSDEAELTDTLVARDMARYFQAIYGSPRTKVENLARVRAHRADAGGRPDERLLFVGDALADLKAATESGADFLFMSAYSTVREALATASAEAGWPAIEDLRALA
ncbi:HAD family hydrolase [Sphingomonas sp. CJ99]